MVKKGERECFFCHCIGPKEYYRLLNEELVRFFKRADQRVNSTSLFCLTCINRARDKIHRAREKARRSSFSSIEVNSLHLQTDSNSTDILSTRNDSTSSSFSIQDSRNASSQRFTNDSSQPPRKRAREENDLFNTNSITSNTQSNSQDVRILSPHIGDVAPNNGINSPTRNLDDFSSSTNNTFESILKRPPIVSLARINIRLPPQIADGESNSLESFESSQRITEQISLVQRRKAAKIRMRQNVDPQIRNSLLHEVNANDVARNPGG